MSLRIAAYQGISVAGDVITNLQKVISVCGQTIEKNVDILCFPECFLQGYVLDKNRAHRLALDINSSDFQTILQKIPKGITVILGLIEKQEDKLYNTAAVLENGSVTGRYRKHNLLAKERFFTPGTDYPVFQKKNVVYGIQICADARMDTGVQELAKKEVDLVFFPLNNVLPRIKALEWKDKHINYLTSHARKNTLWVVSADAVEQSPHSVGYGVTACINPQGAVLKQMPEFMEGMILCEIEAPGNATLKE